MSPQSRTALITGASSGFGRATALRFAEDGWNLVLCARRADRLNEAASECRRAGASAVLAHVLDVADRSAVESWIGNLPADFAAIDLLINNAGFALGLEPAQRADLDQWEQMVDVNIKGLITVTRAVLPRMVERRRGHVINIGSVAATSPYPGGNCYGATKAFVAQFSQNLRADLLGTGVRVTCLEPGLAETEFSIVRFGGDETRAKKVYAGTQPLTGVDIAEACHWVANLPSHVDISRMEIMATCQAHAGFAIHRESASEGAR